MNAADSGMEIRICQNCKERFAIDAKDLKMPPRERRHPIRSKNKNPIDP